MNADLALRVLGTVMGWTDDEARVEFAWLRLMSRIKYDSYGDYLAGLRFTECLARWLQQFAPSTRRDAYDFIKRRLIFVSRGELYRLIDSFFPRFVRPRLMRDAAKLANCPEHFVWANSAARAHYNALRRRTLFLGLSDGARIDVLRRSNVGVLSNEQIALGTQLDNEKWKDMRGELLKDPALASLSEDDRTFNRICVLDDFTASGTTLLRKKDGKWKGKLMKFWKSLEFARSTLKSELPLAADFTVHVHHYIATERAVANARQRHQEALAEFGATAWFSFVDFGASTLLGPSAIVDAESEPSFATLVQEHYDSLLEDRHAAESDVDGMRWGYAGCALCVILEHNTPNNSLPLLWAETPGGGTGKAMRPLFRRRTRHS